MIELKLPQKTYEASKNNDISSKEFKGSSQFTLLLEAYGDKDFTPFVG